MTTLTTFFVAELTDSTGPNEDNEFDDINEALAYAQELSYQQGDLSPAYGIWTLDYQLITIVFAGQIFIPAKEHQS